MYWRIGSAYRKRPREANKAAFCELVKRGPPPGLLAFEGDRAVGWCQLTPRDALPWLDRTWRLKRIDDVPVWSLSCFYVRKGHRKQGITSALIAAALDVAKRAGAPALEAYPLDASLTPSASGTGYASTFERIGFKTVARHVPPRPMMRHDLQSIELCVSSATPHHQEGQIDSNISYRWKEENGHTALTIIEGGPSE
jgi:GNAT superfamily N-acetyltransferase